MMGEEPKGKLFISYSHRDEKWMKELTTYLKVMKIHAELCYWVDTDIRAGEEWYAQIETAIREADAAVMLISADFLASDFIQGKEVPKLLLERAERKMDIFPLMVRHCPWKVVDWLSALQVRPDGAKPLADMPEAKQEKALTDFVQEINGILKEKKEKEEKKKKQESRDRAGADENIDVDTLDMPDTGAFFLGREKELKILDRAWEDGNIHIQVLHAWGGVGKTTLVNRWLEQMKERDYRGARKVYARSFYSQGAEEGKQASAEVFMRELLERFGDPEPGKGTADDRGRRLAELVRKEPALLVLDGMEPLQYPPGEAHGYDGKLKDRGVEVFLKALAGGRASGSGTRKRGKGLVVITTRLPLGGLDRFKGENGPKPIREHALEELDTGTGVRLLRHHGVKGSGAELEKAVREYGGHALALNLLGGYITAVPEYEGDIRRRDEIPALTGAQNRQGYHARRVLSAYGKWLGGTAELELLRLMGLFDRPASAGALEALLEPPAIPGLTEGLQGRTREQNRWSAVKLRRAGLLAEANEEKPGELDSHPLIREHFALELSGGNPAGWQEAHRRLYEYFKALPGKEYPDTLEEMEPLFSAVAHGCLAGEYFEVLDNVYYKRIRRRKEAYNIKKLGAFGSDLAALSHFFETPWSRPALGLLESDEGVLFSWVGFRLRAVGRLREAVLPMKKGLDTMTWLKEWKQASTAAENLSVLKLTLGQLKEAVNLARKAVKYADKCKDKDRQIYVRYSLADALHQAGELEEADLWFGEAERKMKERLSSVRFFYLLGFFQLCDRLLSKGKIRGLLNRAKKIKETANLEGNDLLGEALYNLSFGLILFKKLQQNETKQHAKVKGALTTAVNELRSSGYQDFLVKALLARAAFYRWRGDFDKAETDLEEARELAEMGEMKLFMCDILLETARLTRHRGNPIEAAALFKKAKILIDETGYHRRDSEVEEKKGDRQISSCKFLP